MGRSQYNFTLNVDYRYLIDTHYNINSCKTVEYEANMNVTSLFTQPSKNMFSDVSKIKSTSLTTMSEFMTSKCLPLLPADKPCWWCKYKFNNTPIGAPLKYFDTTKNTDVDICIFLKSQNFKTDDNFYFETEGIFCSFPCCKAYILEQGFRSTKYKNSLTLLTLMYEKIFGKIEEIPVAPSWKLLQKWCGPLSINQFREGFKIYSYDETMNIKRPFLFTTGQIIEQRKIN